VPRQKHVAAEAIHKKMWLNELILLFFVLAGTVYLFLLIIKEGNQHHTAIIHFEDVARKFKRGLIQPGVLPFQTSELQDLQDALSDYLTRLAERYRIILAKIEEFGPSIQQLGEWIGQNDNQHLNIKQNLKGLTEKTYLKLEKFPDLSEQVKHVNADLVISQREAMEIQEFIQQSSDLLYSGPKAIQPFQAQVGEKGQYYQAITGHLKDLQLLLDEIQQTVTSFYGISEQTNLLSLNASIEAARAGEEGDNFSIAATEIEELALKINKASKDLLSLSVLMGKKTTMVIRTLETSLVQNKSEHKHLDEIVDRLNNFVTELNKNLIKIKSYGSMVRDFEAEEQILEKLASILADLKQQSPSNRGRAMAALEVIIDSDKLVASADELADNLTDLKQILAQIQYEPNSEEF
jgi:methyl-accepting chemotaxis protein